MLKMTAPHEDSHDRQVDDDGESSNSGFSRSSTTSDRNSKQSVTGTGVTGSSGNENENSSEAIKAKLSQQNFWQVNMSRFLVIGILVMTAAATSAVVYLVAETSEQNEFASQYESASGKITESFKNIVNRVGTINSIGIAATIEGLRDTDRYMNVTDDGTLSLSSWPYVTLPTFQQRTQTVRVLSEVRYLAIHPVVSNKNRDAWEQYVVDTRAKTWISEGIEYQEQMGWGNFEHNPPSMDEVLMTNQSSQPIYYRNDVGEIVVAASAKMYLPRWQTSPVLKKEPVNFDILNSNMKYSDAAQDSILKRRAVMGKFEITTVGSIEDSNYATRNMATLRSFANNKTVGYLGGPFTNFYIPMFDSLKMNQERNVVAVMVGRILIRQYLLNILPANILGLTAVIEDTCSGNFTFEINGALADVTGTGDLHQPKYTAYGKAVSFDVNNTIFDGTTQGIPLDLDKCQYYIRVYPTQNFEDAYISTTPLLISLGVACVFGFTIIAFLLYNRVVENRQSAILDKAAHSTAIVSSLFPKQVRDRLLEQEDKPSTSSNPKNKMNMQGAINNGPVSTQIADLFPNCTVLFADIAGFTAWSSTRGPEHVFIMLETIYQGFDQVARRRKVFKVETIGDCYLAATGLPEAQSAHAVIMARFASECKLKMNEMTKELEVTLGPDCSELKMRFGMHSGPVTAGVLRGDRARFQLFGDTVNTAARMESTGTKDKIQISQATADILLKSGKSHWIRPREDMVEAKGKGYLKTYWLNTSSSGSKASSDTGSTSNCESIAEASTNSQDLHGSDFIKRERLVDWVVEMLSEQIKRVIVKNEALGFYGNASSVVPYMPQSGEICLDEIREVINLSKLDETIVIPEINPSAFQMDPEALRQLRHYVQLVAAMYHTNPFHNFEHACHVTLSVSKLLKRIISPELSAEDLEQLEGTGDKEVKAHLHARTYGINSDPLAQFAIVFSALIHDVDHRGCSNAQLVKEEVEMGTRYKNKSVAEQNSVDISWSLLMSEQFDKLRKTIFATQAELLRFRQLIVNSVLATDIFDKELNDLRKLRWTKAFAETSGDDVDEHAVDRKATIVIEHIIQASDVSHTMQHWLVYRKWNTQLFKEMHCAYKAGRMAVDPATFWYKGEISFFDNYIIPLANKLKECNVFGVSSDEYLNYAVGNRFEWEHKGEAILEEIIREVSSSEENEN